MKYHQAFFFSAQKVNVNLDLLSQAVGVFQVKKAVFTKEPDCSMIMRIQMNFVTIASFMRERCPWWETEYPWHVWARSWLNQEASMPASTAYWSVSRTERELAMNIDLWVGLRRASYGEEWITLSKAPERIKETLEVHIQYRNYFNSPGRFYSPS